MSDFGILIKDHISEDDLIRNVSCIVHAHPNFGYRMVGACFESHGIRVQQHQIRETMDP